MGFSNVTEAEAIALFFEWSRQFGWAGTFFTREDANNSLVDYHGQQGELTDSEWESVRTSWEWGKGLYEAMTETAWDLVHDATRVVVNERSVS